MGDVLRRALVLTGIGIVIGTGAAWMLTRILAALFVGVSPHDPAIFGGAAATFALVALWRPPCPRSARRASIPWWRSRRLGRPKGDAWSPYRPFSRTRCGQPVITGDTRVALLNVLVNVA